jgi:hypothetical protein
MHVAIIVGAALLRVICYSTSALALTSLIFCGEERTVKRMDAAADVVLGNGRLDERMAAILFVCAALLVAIKLAPGDVMRLVRWSERRSGLG